LDAYIQTGILSRIEVPNADILRLHMPNPHFEKILIRPNASYFDLV